MAEIDYKKLSEELEEVLERLESADISVDEAAALYERGTKIAQKMENYLKTAKNKVEQIKNKFDGD